MSTKKSETRIRYGVAYKHSSLITSYYDGELALAEVVDKIKRVISQGALNVILLKIRIKIKGKREKSTVDVQVIKGGSIEPFKANLNIFFGQREWKQTRIIDRSF